MKDIAQRALALFNDLDADDDPMHRRIILVAMVAEIRCRLKPSDRDIDTLSETVRMALWNIAHSHASDGEKNRALLDDEAYAHRLVTELDYHDGDGPSSG
jgi:hypothetical protein